MICMAMIAFIDAYKAPSHQEADNSTGSAALQLFADLESGSHRSRFQGVV